MSRPSITLYFDDDETLLYALQYIGESDAPIFACDGSSASFDGVTYPLWEGYDDAVAAVTHSQR